MGLKLTECVEFEVDIKNYDASLKVNSTYIKIMKNPLQGAKAKVKKSLRELYAHATTLASDSNAAIAAHRSTRFHPAAMVTTILHRSLNTNMSLRQYWTGEREGLLSEWA